MKKKIICFAAVFAILLIGLIIYIVPKPLSNRFGESNQITAITIQEFSIRDGEPFIDSITYSDITEEQKNGIFALCNQYSYSRTFHTLFSDGSMSGLGDKLIHIYINGNDPTVNQITLSSTGEIGIGNKTYKMRQAEQFIEKMTKILEKSLSSQDR